MARTNSKGRRGEDGHGNRGSTKMRSEEGLRKQKREALKTATPAKRARTTSNDEDSSADPAPPCAQVDDTMRTLAAESFEEIEGEISLQQPNISTNNAATDKMTSAFSIPFTLSQSCDVTIISIISSTSIQQKVTRAFSILSVYPVLPGTKPAVVGLRAKAKVASKMISIVEIVKREISAGENESDGGKWYQYNVVESVLDERKPDARKNKLHKEKKNDGTNKDEDCDENMRDAEEEEEDEEEAFETMKTPFERAIEGREKVRALPIMIIYLSRVRVENLRREYGEQTNGLKLPAT